VGGVVLPLANNRALYKVEWKSETCPKTSSAGTTAQATAATQVAGRAPKRRYGWCGGAV